jgi:hypothetical protein
LEQSVERIIEQNLLEVLNGRDADSRRATIDELWDKDGVFIDPGGVHEGVEKINAVAELLFTQFKVVQGLLRHASYSITMNVYDEAMSEEKRNAHRGVIQQLNRSVTRSAAKPAIPQVVDKVGVPDGI